MNTTSTNSSDMDDTWMKTKALEVYLDVTRDWIYDRVAQRDIPHTKIGRLLRFRKSEIDAWLEANRQA